MGQEDLPKASIQDGIESKCWEESVMPFMVGGLYVASRILWCSVAKDNVCLSVRFDVIYAV